MDWQCGAKTGAAVVHAAKMPKQYILARESMQVQCDGAMADVKMLPAFTAKPSPGFFSDVLHDILEGSRDLQLVVVRPNGEDLEHLFEYAQATVDADGRQETVYLAAPPLPVHGEGSKFVKPHVLPPKRLPSPME